MVTRSLAAGETLRLYNWDDYISDEALDGFSERFDAGVSMDLFADGGEQFAKLRLKNSGYDVTFPSNDVIERMWRNELLEPLDHSLISNLGNISELHLSPPYDPGNRYSVPYMWGVLGIAYRKGAARPSSWRDVLTADGLRRSGRTAWSSEASSMFHVGSMMLGRDLNDYSASNQRDVFEIFTEAKPEVTYIAPDNGQDLLAAGEVDYALEWNGDIASVMEEDDSIDFMIPEEGTLIFVDAMCIPAGAPHLRLAHEFINYILDPKVGRDLAEYIGYATPNSVAIAMSSKEYRSNQVIFPPEGTKLEWPVYPGEEALRLLFENWERMLAS